MAFFVAFPDSVEKVVILREGDGGRNLKRKFHDPIEVRNVSDGDVYVVERTDLYTTAVSAAIRSADMSDPDRSL